MPMSVPPRNWSGSACATNPPPLSKVSPPVCWLIARRRWLVCTSTVPELMNSESMDVPCNAVPPVLRNTPALMNWGVAPDTLMLPSKVVVNVALKRLLNTAPLAALKLPALQSAAPGLTSFPPSRVTFPLITRPPLAVTSGLLTVPPPSVRGPATTTGLLPPRSPPERFNTARVLWESNFKLPPPRFKVVPWTMHPAASVALPAVTAKVDPAGSKVPLATSEAAPALTSREPAPVTSDPAASV